MSPIRAALAFFAILFLAAPTLAQGGVPAEDYARVNVGLVENHALPRYRHLATATAELAQATEGFCAGGRGAGLDAVRAGYHDAMDAWMGVQHLRFGPVEFLMRGFRLYFWPEARGRIAAGIEDLLASGDATSFAPGRLREASVAVQGLPALEYLLYGDGDTTRQTPRCRLLAAISENMRDMAAGILADWQGGDMAFARTLAAPGPNNPYFATHRDATLAFFKSFHGGLQLIADVKLKPILGEALDSARSHLAESGLSGRAFANIVVNLEALQALYLGEGGPGFSSLVRDFGGDTDLDALMRRAFRMTIETARTIDGPLAEAVTDPARRPQAEKLLTQVLALKQIARTRLAAALDLQVGFNALDGD